MREVVFLALLEKKGSMTGRQLTLKWRCATSISPAASIIVLGLRLWKLEEQSARMSSCGASYVYIARHNGDGRSFAILRLLYSLFLA